MLYYINSLLVYSVIGFSLESLVFKLSNTNKHSGIFYGPFTMVYGIGAVSLLLLNKYLFPKLKVNKYLKILLMYIIIVITLSLIEFLGGHVLHFIFNIDMWNYAEHKIHFGKYICLINSLAWGFFGLFYLYFLKDFLDKLIKRISPKTTYLFIFIFMIDLIMIIITKT